jgi:hypothetical protein
VPRVKYAIDYWPKNSFSMSYASLKVIFPGVELWSIKREMGDEDANNVEVASGCEKSGVQLA